jgi:regulator of protease activity HflC (stomatin/prohibitin superfamily)
MNEEQALAPSPLSEIGITYEAREENGALCNMLSLATLGILRFFAVPLGYVRFVTLFGRPLRTAQPGLNKCVSFFGLYQKPGPCIPIKEQIDDHEVDMVFTKDGVKSNVELVVFYRIVDPVKAFYEISDYQRAISDLVKALLRNECGSLAARDLLGSRQKLANNLKETLDHDTEPWGISVRLIEIKAINIAVQDGNLAR